MRDKYHLESIWFWILSKEELGWYLCIGCICHIHSSFFQTFLQPRWVSSLTPSARCTHPIGQKLPGNGGRGFRLAASAVTHSERRLRLADVPEPEPADWLILVRLAAEMTGEWCWCCDNGSHPDKQHLDRVCLKNTAAAQRVRWPRPDGKAAGWENTGEGSSSCGSERVS